MRFALLKTHIWQNQNLQLLRFYDLKRNVDSALNLVSGSKNSRTILEREYPNTRIIKREKIFDKLVDDHA